MVFRPHCYSLFFKERLIKTKNIVLNQITNLHTALLIVFLKKFSGRKNKSNKDAQKVINLLKISDSTTV